MQAITNDMIHIRYADDDEPLVVLNAVIQRYGDKAAFMLVPDCLWEKFGKGTPHQRSVRKRTKRNYRRGFTANQTTGIRQIGTGTGGGMMKRSGDRTMYIEPSP